MYVHPTICTTTMISGPEFEGMLPGTVWRAPEDCDRTMLLCGLCVLVLQSGGYRRLRPRYDMVDDDPSFWLRVYGVVVRLAQPPRTTLNEYPQIKDISSSTEPSRGRDQPWSSPRYRGHRRWGEGRVKQNFSVGRLGYPLVL